jgi:hypothetical protein
MSGGSWYISRLIKDSTAIRTGNNSDWGFMLDCLDLGEDGAFRLHENDGDLFDSDDYNNLLILEKKINSLYSQGKLSLFELETIKEMSQNKSKYQLTKSLGKDYKTIMSIFDHLTEMLGFCLGGIFTNEGYLDYMVNKYKLSPEKSRMVESFMEYRGLK